MEDQRSSQLATPKLVNIIYKRTVQQLIKMIGQVIQITNPFGVLYPLYIAEKQQKWVDVTITNINIKEDKIIFHYNVINTLRYELVWSPTFYDIVLGFKTIWRFKE